MIKWTMFALGSLVWIATCWFFGQMVGGTNAGPKSTIAQQECAERLLREAGGVGDYFALYQSPECIAEQRRVFAERSAPASRKGLAWGLIPVILIGGIMVLRARRG